MPYQPNGQLKEFLKRLPKTETHLHIEGALPWHLIHELDPKRFPSPPASWQDGYKFSDFAHFEGELLEMAGAWFTSPERYHEAAGIVFRQLQEEENVQYVETSFASGVIEFMDLDGKAVAEAIKAAAPPGLTVRMFMGIHHDGYTPRSKGFIEECLHWESLDGVDLHGTETTPLESWTADFWKRARDAGKQTKAHAGEFAGADFVWRVVDELGVTRIQHGIRSIEDPKLVQHLVNVGAVLDFCPISNVKLNVVEKMADHPMRQLFDAGIICTLSTDDPVSFGNSLTEEYVAIHDELDFTYAELGTIAANGFRHSIDGGAAFANQIETINALVGEYSEEG
jgi:adenosine deaminase